MPTVTTAPIMSLLGLNLRDFYLTLEQKTPTIMTDRSPQDLTIITAGKEAYMTALLYVHILKLTINPHINDFPQGTTTHVYDLQR
jgi:hypothetical protein